MNKALLFTFLGLFSLSLTGQQFGNAISLDGIDDYAFVPHNSSLDPGTSSFTMSCWVKVSDTEQRSNIVLKRIGQYPWTQYAFGFGEGDPHVAGPGKHFIVNYIQAAEAKERSGYSTEEVVDGEWHHFAVIADRVQNGIFIYKDGLLVDFTPVYYVGNWPDVFNQEDLFIGYSSGGNHLEATLDELILWNRAISSNILQKLLTAPLPSSYYVNNDSGVVAYYRFEEYEDLGIGNVGSNDVRDIGPFGNHMSCDGGPYLVPSVPNASVDDPGNGMDEIEIYPNPCPGILYIRDQAPETGSLRIELISISGTMVRAFPQGMQAKVGGEISLDLSDIPPGMYFVKIVKGDNTLIKKLLIN
jgi:hypothetical protein